MLTRAHEDLYEAPRRDATRGGTGHADVPVKMGVSEWPSQVG